MNWKLIFMLLTFVFSGGRSDAPLPKADGELAGKFYTGGALEDGNFGGDGPYFYVWLEGEGAKVMYHQMDVEAEEDFCLDDGSMTKMDEKIQCTVGPDGTEYKCYFSVNVPEEEVELGTTC